MLTSILDSLKNKEQFDLRSKQALLLIQVAQTLNKLTGGDIELIHHFINTLNDMAKGVPLQ